MPAKKKAVPAPKTDALSIRIDPRLRFGLEMMARRQRRSVTGVVEWAIDSTLKSEQAADNGYGEPLTFEDLLNQVWRPNEVERLVNLAQKFPSLLTYEETRVWEVIRLSRDFWESSKKNRSVDKQIRRQVLVDQWEKVKPLIEGAANKSVILGLTASELDAAGVVDAATPDHLDDDIPF